MTHKASTPPNPCQFASSSSGATVHVCGPAADANCALYLKSMSLFNLLPANPAQLASTGPEGQIAAMLGNFTSLLWAFNITRWVGGIVVIAPAVASARTTLFPQFHVL